MKVIVAGLSKTGTKSMNAALTELGYNVYDYLEHFQIHGSDWLSIFKGKDYIKIFRKMYENVDVVVDVPACIYWKEIHEAFPDAKIILTLRDEDSWYKSLHSQMSQFNSHMDSFFVVILLKLTPYYRTFVKYTENYEKHLGLVKKKKGVFSQQMVLNKEEIVEKFKKHNAKVIKEAPKDKLLVYNVTEGWEPLCKFLGKKVPSKPFPHKNLGGKEVVEQLHHNSDFGKEGIFQMFLMLIFSIIFILLLYFCLDFNTFILCFVTLTCGFLILLYIL